jgi:DNA-binding response OmpR family regulator
VESWKTKQGIHSSLAGDWIMAESVHILILEDSPNDVELIKFELQEAGLSYTARVATTEADYVRELLEGTTDLIISDYDLPKYNGALALAEARRRCPDTPFILVTGAVTEDRAIEILTQGAKDYVLKSRLEQRLVPAVRRALAEAKEQLARKQAEQELREANRTLEERVEIKTAELQAEIGARKQMEGALLESEKYRSLLVEVLGILNDSLPLGDTIHYILTAIKRETRFDAVGIRLRNGDDFPYFVQSGFSDEFLLAENTLTVRAQDGGLCKDENGNISLECTCGLVLSGKTDPTNKLFTQGGSFWTNDTLPLLDLFSDDDPRVNPRNRCIHEGFRSVALIPIRANRDIVGLLQLNDRKMGSFTLDMITYFEGLGTSIGIALSLKQRGGARHRPADYQPVRQSYLCGRRSG